MTGPATASSTTTARPTGSSRRSTAGRRCGRSAGSTSRSNAGMCTSIVEIVDASGAGKTGDGWIDLTHAVVSYDHPHHALLEEAITIDFVNSAMAPGARVAVELTLETGKALRDALTRAIAAADKEEAE